MSDDLREQISRLEAQIEELATAIERCRKIELVSKIAIAAGAVMVLAVVLGAVRFDPTVLFGGIAAVIGGTVLFGSNSTTLVQTLAAQEAAQALRVELINKIDLRVVGHVGPNGRFPRLIDSDTD
ncbi:MAG: hypothetical protein QOG83_1513 [Alphaproteobacteria bacterium]|nr:hypothetical protein [Alphaproteobacteria bacterium]